MPERPPKKPAPRTNEPVIADAQTKPAANQLEPLPGGAVADDKAIDLETLGPGAKLDNLPALETTVSATLPETVIQKPEDPTDKARKHIAYWLLGILTGIVVVSFALLLWALGSGHDNTENNFKHINGLLNIIYGPVVTLVGSAVGFYFGAQSAKAENEDS